MLKQKSPAKTAEKSCVRGAVWKTIELSTIQVPCFWCVWLEKEFVVQAIPHQKDKKIHPQKIAQHLLEYNDGPSARTEN